MSNDYAGVYGQSNILTPLLIELERLGHSIVFHGFHDDGVLLSRNTFAESFLSAESYRATVSCDNSIADVLLAEARFVEHAKFVELVRLIKLYLAASKIVFVLDGDLWGASLRSHLSDVEWSRVNFLCPYVKNINNLHNYHYFPYFFTTSAVKKSKIFDFGYVGNAYNREEQFLSYYGSVADHSTVIVAGNFTKASKIERFAHLFGKILFVGEIKHCYCKDLLSRCKFSLMLLSSDYKAAGLVSNRFYECIDSMCMPVFLSGTLFDDNIKEHAVVVDDVEQLLEILDNYKGMLREEYINSTKTFLQAAGYTVSARARQFISLAGKKE